MRVTFFLAIYLFFASTSIAQTSTFSVALNQDNAFGFAPAVYGSFGIKEKLDFTYYGIFWTNHAYTNEGGDAWTETGIGLGFPALDGKALSILPLVLRMVAYYPIVLLVVLEKELSPM